MKWTGAPGPGMASCRQGATLLLTALCTVASDACVPPDSGDAPAAPPSSWPATARRLTDGPGNEHHPRISPDGTTLSFDAVVDGTSRIQLMDLANGTTRPLESGAPGDRRAAWSPDGTRIAFISDRAGAPGIWIVPTDGGDARLLFETEGASIAAPDWSPDGRHITASQVVPGAGGNVSYGRVTVLSVDVSDGTATELTTKGDEWWPKWSADGRWVYYYVGLSDDLEAVDVATGEVRKLFEDRFVGWRPAVSPSGTTVAFVSDMQGLGLWVAPMDGGDPNLLLDWGSPDAPAFDPSGSTVVFSADTTRTAIVRVDLRSHTRTVLVTGGRAPRPTADDGLAYLPDRRRGRVVVLAGQQRTDTLRLTHDHVADLDVSLDGRYLAVTVPTPGTTKARHDLHLFDAGGSYVRRLTHTGDVFGAIWCNDGRTLVFASRGGKANNRFRQLWAVDRDGGTPEQLSDAEDTNKWPTHCDRNGTRITYEHRLIDPGLFLVDRKDGVASVTALGDGTQARWSPDGERLAYVAYRDGRTDLFVRGPDGSETRITDDDALEAEPRWSHDGAALLFTVRHPNRDLWALPVPR